MLSWFFLFLLFFPYHDLWIITKEIKFNW
jgi:hypothetical protein